MVAKVLELGLRKEYEEITKVLQGRAVAEVAERVRMTATTKAAAIARRAMRDEKLKLEEKMGRDIGVTEKTGKGKR